MAREVANVVGHISPLVDGDDHEPMSIVAAHCTFGKLLTGAHGRETTFSAYHTNWRPDSGDKARNTLKVAFSGIPITST